MYFLEQKYKLWWRQNGIKNGKSHTRRRTLRFSLYKNRKLKVKLRWVGARERKNRTFFVPFIFSEENFLNICVSSQCIVYWIHFQNIHIFTYQKKLLHTLFSLFLKSSKAFNVSLIWRMNSDKIEYKRQPNKQNKSRQIQKVLAKNS